VFRSGRVTRCRPWIGLRGPLDAARDGLRRSIHRTPKKSVNSGLFRFDTPQPRAYTPRPRRPLGHVLRAVFCLNRKRNFASGGAL